MKQKALEAAAKAAEKGFEEAARLLKNGKIDQKALAEAAERVFRAAKKAAR